MPTDLLNTGIQLIVKDLKLENDQELSSTSSDELIMKLTRIISYLLDHDFERLLSAFYRIDLPEEVVTHILHHEQSDKIAQSLAQKVVERELLKAKYRIKYSS